MFAQLTLLLVKLFQKLGHPKQGDFQAEIFDKNEETIDEPLAEMETEQSPPKAVRYAKRGVFEDKLYTNTLCMTMLICLFCVFVTFAQALM